METNNKLREAMKAIRKEVYLYAIEEDKQDFAHLHEAMLDNPPEYKDLINSFFAIAHLVDAALAEPVRNCDIGTLEDRREQFKQFCKSHSDGVACNRDCPLFKLHINGYSCHFEWGELPFESEV